MTREKNKKKYAVVGNWNEMHIVQKMGVQEKNVIESNRINELLNHIVAGDVLCVATVVSFATGAYDLFCKMQYLANCGVEFKSGREKYLNFSSVNPLSLGTVEILRDFASREKAFAEWVKQSKLPDKAKPQLIGRICAESLADISLVFCNNGIRKKGN